MSEIKIAIICTYTVAALVVLSNCEDKTSREYVFIKCIENIKDIEKCAKFAPRRIPGVMNEKI